MARKRRTGTIIVPRDYGFAVTERTTGFKYWLFPERFIRADILTKTPGERRAQLRGFLADNESSPCLENMVAKDFASVETALRKGIKAKEGVYTLWRVRKEDAVINYDFYDDILSGNVRTIRHAKTKGPYRAVKIGAPWEIASEFLSDFYDTSSSDVEWSVVKRGKKEMRVRVIDLAAATMLTEMAKRDSSGFLPFYFFDKPDLEMNVLINHYANGVLYYEIDKALMDLEDIINPILLERVSNGEITVEVYRQHMRKKRCSDAEKIEAEERLQKNMGIWFKREGYKNAGISLELKGTEYEKAGARWHKNGIVCVSLFYDNIPPLVIIKREPLERNDVDFFHKEGFGGNPLEHMGTYRPWLDDMTRHIMNCCIAPPWSGMAVPPELKQDYIELFRKHCPKRENFLSGKLG